MEIELRARRIQDIQRADRLLHPLVAMAVLPVLLRHATSSGKPRGAPIRHQGLPALSDGHPVPVGVPGEIARRVQATGGVDAEPRPRQLWVYFLLRGAGRAGPDLRLAG